MSHIKTAVNVMITAMIISLIMTYASVMTIVQTTRSNTERVLNSFVIDNSTAIYDSIKNGNNYLSAINTNYFAYILYQDGTLEFDGTYMYNKNSEGEIVYKLTSPVTTFTINNTLNLTSNLEVLIPLEFAGKHFTEMRIPITVKRSYNLKN
jgi:hypothetical protein